MGKDNKDNVDEVIHYYHKTESRIGYDLFLAGTKHFGFYEQGDSPWNWSQALRKMEDKLGATLGLRKGSSVLDAGCGNGDVAAYTASKYGLRVSGIDVLDFNIEEARRRSIQKGLDDLLNFREMSYAALEFPDNFFDGVYTMETLVHAGDAKAVLGEFIRVLKPGGKIVLFEYSKDPDSLMSTRASKAYREVNYISAMSSFQRFEHAQGSRIPLSAGRGHYRKYVADGSMLRATWQGSLRYRSSDRAAR